MFRMGMGRKLNVITDIQCMGRKLKVFRYVENRNGYSKLNVITDIQSMGRRLKIFKYVENRYG